MRLIENNYGLLVIIIILLISIGGLVEIVPLFFITSPIGYGSPTEPTWNAQLYSALRLEGRDIYIREGCASCHSQMIRTNYLETERYGQYSIAGEFVYDHPALWGSKRTGSDLTRIGNRYSNLWHSEYLNNPGKIIADSIMPRYSWLAKNTLDGTLIIKKMQAMNKLILLTCSKCRIYSEIEIEEAPAKIRGKTEAEALIAYINGDLEQPDGLGRLHLQR